MEGTNRKIEMLLLPLGSIQLTIYWVEEEIESYQMHVCLPSADDSLGRCSGRGRPTLVKIFKVSRIFKWVFAGAGGGFWLYNLAGFVGERKFASFRVYNPIKPHLCPTYPIEDTNDVYRNYLCNRLDPTELEHTVVQSRSRAFRCMSVCRDPMAGSEDISSFLLVSSIFMDTDLRLLSAHARGAERVFRRCLSWRWQRQ